MMAASELSVEFVIYDPFNDTYKGTRDAATEWVKNIGAAKRFMVVANSQRHCYLDRFEVVSVNVIKTVEVTLANNG